LAQLGFDGGPAEKARPQPIQSVMHTDEVLIDAPLVRQLIDTQFPK
jgi:hypothetical protein